jgi:dienelactone hydrolase
MVATRDVEYSADGTIMVGRLALPDGAGKRPALLIAHEGPGLDDEQRGRAHQLAELGYVAFALDYQVEHSFTHPAADPGVTGLPGIKYDPRAADRSWRTMLELFDEVFG